MNAANNAQMAAIDETQGSEKTAQKKGPTLYTFDLVTDCGAKVKIRAKKSKAAKMVHREGKKPTAERPKGGNYAVLFSKERVRVSHSGGEMSVKLIK